MQTLAKDCCIQQSFAKVWILSSPGPQTEVYLANKLVQPEYGILVNNIAPGIFPTRMTRGLLSAMGKESEKDFNNVGRLGLPEDIGAACLYLASEASTFVCGSTLVVDGGYLLSCRL